MRIVFSPCHILRLRSSGTDHCADWSMVHLKDTSHISPPPYCNTGNLLGNPQHTGHCSPSHRIASCTRKSGRRKSNSQHPEESRNPPSHIPLYLCWSKCLCCIQESPSIWDYRCWSRIPPHRLDSPHKPTNFDRNAFLFHNRVHQHRPLSFCRSIDCLGIRGFSCRRRCWLDIHHCCMRGFAGIARWLYWSDSLHCRVEWKHIVLGTFWNIFLPHMMGSNGK